MPKSRMAYFYGLLSLVALLVVTGPTEAATVRVIELINSTIDNSSSWHSASLNSTAALRGVSLRSGFTRKPDRSFSDNYQLKLSMDLKSQGEYRLENQALGLHHQTMERMKLDQMQAQRLAIYSQLLEFLRLKDELQYRQELIALLGKKIKLTQYSAERAGISKVAQLIDLNERMELERGEVFLAQRSIKRITAKLNSMSGGKWQLAGKDQFDRSGMVNVATIKRFAQQVDIGQRLELILVGQNNRLAIAGHELELEVARGSRVLDSLHFGYEREQELLKSGQEESEKSLFVQLTFALPMSKTYSAIAKRVDQHIKQREFQNTKTASEYKLKQLQGELLDLIGLYQQMENSRYSKSLHKYRRSMRKMRGQTPQTLLSLREKLLNYRHRLSTMENRVQQKYLELLSAGDFLITNPGKNYLQGA